MRLTRPSSKIPPGMTKSTTPGLVSRCLRMERSTRYSSKNSVQYAAIRPRVGDGGSEPFRLISHAGHVLEISNCTSCELPHRTGEHDGVGERATLTRCLVRRHQRRKPFDCCQSGLCHRDCAVLLRNCLAVGWRAHPVEHAPYLRHVRKRLALAEKRKDAAGLRDSEISRGWRRMEHKIRRDVASAAHNLQLPLHHRDHLRRRRAEMLRRIFGKNHVLRRRRVADEPHVGVEVHLVRSVKDRCAAAVDANRIPRDALLARACNVLAYPRHLRRRNRACAKVFAERVALRAKRQRRIALQVLVCREPRDEVRLRHLRLDLVADAVTAPAMILA